GGMLEVQPHVITILADTAIRADNLDEAQALEAKERAEKLLSEKSADIDYAKAQAELAQSMAQLAAIRKLREKKK
ncbi:MAG: ATP synthase delta/epsilon chain alpha-helix domain-containing protein, partial [Gammaproteobacteria bacterium]